MPKIINKINADGTTFDAEPIVTRTVEQGNQLPVIGGAVWEAIHSARAILEQAVTQLQSKVLSAPVTYNGETYSTVEELIAAIAENHTDSVTQGSSAVITAGGTYADKSAVAASGSLKNFTAGGAYKYFAKQTTALAWLKKVFGDDYETKLANGYFVD